MLDKLRGFSKSKLAIVLVGIIIIPFVFWGMGSVFSSGNTNSIAKINNKNISTQDFVDHINSSRISSQVIKENIDKNILEDLLGELISSVLLNMEINDLEVLVSEKTLSEKIINNNEFLDENKNFSRIKYEKFLLENNMSAVEFEMRLKDRELKRNLFNYISGGIKSPKFMVSNFYKEENKKIIIEYINLNNVYKSNFSEDEINKFIVDNEDKLKRDFINISYVKITPQNLIDVNEFNNEFFKKIDEIENSILNGLNINDISLKYNLKITNKDNYNSQSGKNNTELDEIFNKRNEDKIQILDKNDFYLLYQINKINKILPDRSDTKFLDQINKNLLLKEKYDFNQNLLLKIQDSKFKDEDFKSISEISNELKTTKINSIKDNNIFDINSIKLLYSMPLNNFLLMGDENKNIYLVKVINFEQEFLPVDSKDYKTYVQKTNLNIKNSLYTSYDFFLNEKYKVKVHQNTFERVKNYFN
tara:strand:+ start:1171 stop:2595 length:1425 start_codon:yes stop_codon:yes gene_type:complete